MARQTKCHTCRQDWRRKNKAEEWEEKFGERDIAQDGKTCSLCHKFFTWWWFSPLPITAKECAEVLARGELRKKHA